MDPQLQPDKNDIEAVFHKLRAIPTNKVCFDCNSKNPTWSSVTYGVFICIDCSAVHRSLGVHLTFVRSTQLDTNWTWMQLRQMQLGGNANATQFFQLHNCNTNDAQKKYNSRAAQLYKDKLNLVALRSLKTDTQLHVHPHHEEKVEEKVVDFFSEHENFVCPDLPEQHLSKPVENSSVDNNSTEGPKVDFAINSEPRKSTITTRKPPTKKLGLGAKKGGLGATKVKTNFADLEREAERVEESKLRLVEESAKAVLLSQKEQEDREAAVRLAYQDLSNMQVKKEEQVRKKDPLKADQVERLGMGVSARTGISHSAVSDMHLIQQDNLQSAPSTLSSLGKLRITDDGFFDDLTFGSGFNINRNSTNSFGSSKLEAFLAESNSGHDNWVVVEDLPPEKPKNSHRQSVEKSSRNFVDSTTSDVAQKKFGNAKAISSDQYFNDPNADYETKASLSRFQGSSSISSSELFGNGKDNMRNSHNPMQYYDVEEVKESVRQGVSKVAGKISSLANGVMSSLQDKYGY